MKQDIMKQLEAECKKEFDNFVQKCIKDSSKEEEVVMQGKAFIAGFELGSNAAATMLMSHFHDFINKHQDKLKGNNDEYSFESNSSTLYH